MLLLRKWRLHVFVLAVACLVPCLSAEIRETRVYHGKKFQCVHGGFSMIGGGRVCGTQGYARVFTGTVKSAIEISDTDKQLTLVPDEIFSGDRASEVTATVDQACMPQGQPEIQAGQKWLFYLREDGELPFDSPSKPLSEAQDDIAVLRHLARLTGHQAIITGNVQRIWGDERQVESGCGAKSQDCREGRIRRVRRIDQLQRALRVRTSSRFLRSDSERGTRSAGSREHHAESRHVYCERRMP